MSLTYVELETVTDIGNLHAGYALLVWLRSTEPEMAASPREFRSQATETVWVRGGVQAVDGVVGDVGVVGVVGDVGDVGDVGVVGVVGVVYTQGT